MYQLRANLFEVQDNFFNEYGLYGSYIENRQWSASKTPYRVIIQATVPFASQYLTQFCNDVWGEGIAKPKRGAWKFDFNSVPYVYVTPFHVYGGHDRKDIYDHVFIKPECFLHPMILMSYPGLSKFIRDTIVRNRFDWRAALNPVSNYERRHYSVEWDKV